MNPSPSAALPMIEPSWRAYARPVISSLPALAAFVFASVFLLPKLQQVWGEVGLGGSAARWLLSFSNGFLHNFWFIVLGMALLVVLLEARVRSWSRHRGAALFSAAVLLNSAVFIWVLALATAALLAASAR